MMRLIIRPAHPLDCRQMADLLNEIIAIGGTTAMVIPVTGANLRLRLTEARSAWHVAESEEGKILGFQYITPGDALPEEAAEIATFAKPGAQGVGIGSRLFEATRPAARDLGYQWINANIRADNTSGLAYYQSRGFEDYGRIQDYELADGTVVDKILKRFDL